ncbi:homocysteine-responsive endoplasmic reticulum-resident ubiquitin-like domain member 2 protein isoform X5 [Corvus cornix cornix]|uniref:homocysteine-responsive endoplasmic reticulum-resident ubiquitin-like domain member 2 protein isoform X2 n=1 Tax=Corvus brachyrhynchos TaxID=85066 RepID=UPI0008166EF0|nr:PREDICTED: homocysteine-responsive endoplasmic reticulum-resident ubiquitin-like domain member 2 protein isoform X2 [Corvus brachyrhynchos]XP_039428645.1 homocysteine-responsive endoplasmic reticulum-resident ubiquitin-like domain member 2 protein isoform X5 [Corvus cornix cornix]XP_041898781.1 homocysteine-responsive endoplasmic reticulum-resident ubiquitin-like domain member 2 protein isoform X5 [Corvus kubaryi]
MDQSVVEHPVTLIIKAPNQKYTDQTISCFLEWTVGKLKSHLSKVYPSKPQDEYHMVHLVCTSRTPPSSPKPSTSREGHGASTSSSSSNSDRSGSTAASPTNQEASSTSLNTSADGVRHRNLPQAHSNSTPSHQFPYLMQGNIGNQFPGQGVPVGFSMYPAFSPLQMIWWQQMYVRQYYMQYQAAVSAQVTSSTEPARSAVAQAVNSEHARANEPAAVPNVAVQENRPVNQNVQMNAQGGPVVNEEDFNRDWLDWMYTFSRAAILLSIVYFYSSFSRFVMVMGAMLLVYLHQAGWFPFRQEGGQQQAANNAEVNRDGQHANNPDLEEMERLMDDGIDEDNGEDAGEDGNTEQQPGFMASAWSFITTFFTSLIPEGPPQVGN